MKNFSKFFLLLITCLLILTMIVSGQTNSFSPKKFLSHNQMLGNEQGFVKNGGKNVANYGSPAFNNPNYYYAVVKTPASGYYYVQAGLSPDGQKIVAEKYQDGGPYGFQNPAIVLMNADGSGETTISGVIGGDIFGYMNPFWSDDGTVVGYLEVHLTAPNKLVTYTLSGGGHAYLYEPAPLGVLSINNPDFLGSSKTTVVFWDNPPSGTGESDLYTWDSITLTRTNITNSVGYKEYEPVSNAAGDKIVYWSGETIAEPTNTTHTLTYSGGVWTKDVGFTPIVDSYWPFWSTRSDNYIGATVMSSKDVLIYNSNGTSAFDLTGPGYSGGAGQRNFLGIGFEGPNGEMLITSNAGRVNPGRDIVFAAPRTKLYVNASTGNDLLPGTLNAPFATIGKAVTEAIAGGTVYVAAGTYTETVTVNKSLTITGTGSPTVTGGFILAASPITITGFASSSTATVNVQPGGSIQTALDLVNSGGTVNIAAGTYLAFNINKPVTLNGSGIVIINHGSPAMTVSSTGVVINGFTFTFNSSDYAIDVLAGAYNVTIVNCNFQNTNLPNVGNGVRNQGTGTVTAINNYWGDPNGPTVSSSACGSGCIASNTSTGTLTYSPWYVEAAHTNLLASPTLIFPASLAVGITVVPNFQWSFPIAGAPTYTVEIATDYAFTNVVFGPTAPTPATATYYQLPAMNALVNATTYYWRIKATIGAGTSCSIGSFTTIAPAMPYLDYPTTGTILSYTSTTFQWHPYPYTTGIQYEFQISTSTDFGSTVVDQTTTNTYYTVSNTTFTQGTTYYWRVIAKTLPLSGSPVIIDYSNTWQFSMPGLPQPIASYPTGNVSVYANPPTLYWYLTTYNSKVTEYIVKYSTSTFTIPVAGDFVAPSASGGYFRTNSTNMYITIPFALTPGTRYYWRVAAWDGTTDKTTLTNWSAIESFTIYGSQAFVICYPSYPVGGGTIYTNPPTLYWYTNLFAPGLTYGIQYSTSSTFGGTTFSTYGGTTYTSPTTSYSITGGSLAAGHWYWRVAASFDGGITYGPSSTPGDFVVSSSTAATAPTPAPSSPNGGIVVSVTNPTLYWYAYSTSPLQYLVRYSTNPTITGDSLSVSAVTSPLLSTNSYVLTGLTRGATYYWQVKSKVVGTAMSTSSSWSTLAWFTVSPGAAAVVPLAGSPINGTPVKTTSTELSWVIPVQSSSPMSYTVQYSKQSDFGNSVTISDVTDTKVTVNNLEKGTTYYWRAQSKTTTGSVSSYSAPTSFKTDGVTSVTSEQAAPTSFELSQNYPNPFNPSTNIVYSLPQNSFVTIKIYDMLGREVKTLVSGEMTSGVHTIAWMGDNHNGDLVASGTYIYRITVGDFVATKKMVLLK